ncbi:MAG: DUF58 domain-containing protein [Candidatus Pacearchaeota archaeon]
MEDPKRFNADISGSISEFEYLMKEFVLKKKLYRMLFIAKALDFDGYREYSTLDDASAIDWKASLRANEILVKKYKEEENLKVVFVVDTSENMVIGSEKKLKCEYAAEVVAALSHFIMSTEDKIGMVFFGSNVKDYLPPARGDNHFRLIVDILTNPENYYGWSNLKDALEYLLSYVSSNAVIIVSDFLSFDKETKETLNLVANKFETMALIIKDPIDKTLPKVFGEIAIEDPKTGKQILINPAIARKSYEKNAMKKEEFLRSSLTEIGVDFVELTTNVSFIPLLAEFLKTRIKR